MGGTRQRVEGELAFREVPLPTILAGPLLLLAEGLALALAAAAVGIPPLVIQLFRALLTF